MLRWEDLGMGLTGVIVAAGYGTRFLPVTRVVPKELLPLVDRPCLDVVVRELVAAGIDRLVVVTSRRKRAVEDWFDHDPELEAALARRPDRLAAAQPPRVSVTFVRQARMGGTGDAILAARAAAGDGPLLVVFPDDLFAGPGPVPAMIALWKQTGASVLAAADLTGQDVSAYGVLAARPREGGWQVDGIVEKPAPGAEPSHLISVGRFLYTPDLLDALARHRAHHTTGEYYPMAALNELAERGALCAVPVVGQRYDTGQPLGWLEAVLDEALARPELAEPVRALLRSRLSGAS
jgi:UTP--glucose-1-phosphate uridylyltransferase